MDDPKPLPQQQQQQQPPPPSPQQPSPPPPQQQPPPPPPPPQKQPPPPPQHQQQQRHQPQQQQLPFRQLQQQQQQQQQQQLQAAMARFPSNIDAHLRPLGAIRPINPNLNSYSVSINPNLTSLQHNKVNRTPPQPQLHPPQVDVWRPHSDLKRPFDPPERDKATDDTFFSVRDRKVRISDSNAIYALCRSWLRNAYHEESQPQHGEVLKSLPKPLPVPEASLEKKTTDNELDDKDVNATATSSAEELLQGHIKRAKRVRERLREERLRRIKRYQSRLKLLLPPPIEQCRGDTAPS